MSEEMGGWHGHVWPTNVLASSAPTSRTALDIIGTWLDVGERAIQDWLRE
jgi:hypothetical protein